MNLDDFKDKSFSYVTTYRIRLGGAKESICIKRYTYPDRRYTVINLHGSFFDSVKNFKMDRFMKYISRYKFTPKQLDIAFNDDEKHISKERVLYWCNYCEDNCMGSMVEKQAPDVVLTKRELNRIQLLSPKSKVNYGTIYFRPDTGNFRLEIKFRAKNKICQILDTLGPDRTQFENFCRRALVSCINFVRPSSRKSKRPEKYKIHPEWMAFLGGNVKKIVWSNKKDANIDKSADTPKKTFFTRIKPNKVFTNKARDQKLAIIKKRKKQ